MERGEAFNRFAPTILRVYHRDKEAFWKAILAPFLVNQILLVAWLGHLKVDMGLFAAFQGLDDDARQVLKEFGARFDLDVTTWKSNRIRYLKDAYPVFAFLAVWMNEEGLSSVLKCFAEILRAGVFAVAGYGILDANVDSDRPSAVEILTAQALIAEYETLMLCIFGVSNVNLGIIQRMRNLFLQAEVKEKSTRRKVSPYRLENPKELAPKGPMPWRPLC